MKHNTQLDGAGYLSWLCCSESCNCFFQFLSNCMTPAPCPSGLENQHAIVQKTVPRDVQSLEIVVSCQICFSSAPQSHNRLSS